PQADVLDAIASHRMRNLARESRARLPTARHAPLRNHDLRKRVPAVPGPTDHRKTDSAVVRRVRGGVDDVPRLLSNRAAPRLRVCRLERAYAEGEAGGTVGRSAAHCKVCTVAGRCG